VRRTDYIHRSFRLLVATRYSIQFLVFVRRCIFFVSSRTVLFEELLILTVTSCIGVHGSNFHEV